MPVVGILRTAADVGRGDVRRQPDLPAMNCDWAYAVPRHGTDVHPWSVRPRPSDEDFSSAHGKSARRDWRSHARKWTRADVRNDGSDPYAQHRTRRLTDDVVGRRSEEHVIDCAVAVCAEHDEIRVPFTRNADDFAIRRARRDESLDLHARRSVCDDRIEALLDIPLQVVE